jgi:hypothetical protein
VNRCARRPGRRSYIGGVAGRKPRQWLIRKHRMHVPSGLVPTAGRPVVVIVAHVYEVQCGRNVAGPILELKVGRSRRHREINRLFHSIRTARTWVQQQNQQQYLHNTHTDVQVCAGGVHRKRSRPAVHRPFVFCVSRDVWSWLDKAGEARTWHRISPVDGD